jgi:hypothetical protein
MATTVVGFIGVRLLVMLAARDHYLPTETRRLPELGTGYSQMRNDLNGDWIVATRAVVDRAECPGGGSDCVGTGLERAYEVLIVHPARQFWTFQAIERAIFVVLAVGWLVGTIYWTRRRIA